MFNRKMKEEIASLRAKAEIYNRELDLRAEQSRLMTSLLREVLDSRIPTQDLKSRIRVFLGNGQV